MENLTVRSNRSWVILAIAAVMVVTLLAACGGKQASVTVPEGAQAGELVGREPCIYERGDVEYTAECGTLVVPENRSEPDSRLIALPVIRVQALGDSPAEPIFWLTGGPGESNMHFPSLKGLIEDHDIVMVGYRGMDGSVVMECPEMAKAATGLGDNFLSEASTASFGEAMTRCAKRLEAEGVDLDGYSIPKVVEDMEDARAALGYERVNLLSGSYGTRVAMIYSWMYPDSLHRSVMIAVNPVLAENCRPLRDLLANPSHPKALSIVSYWFSNGCRFAARTAPSH